VNDQVPQERLYSELRNGGRTLGIPKEMAGQLKSTEKQMQQRKSAVTRPSTAPQEKLNMRTR
jgi:hypothetical protein